MGSHLSFQGMLELISPMFGEGEEGRGGWSHIEEEPEWKGLRGGLGQWFSKPGIRTSDVNTTRELVRNTHPDIPSSCIPSLGVYLCFVKFSKGL